MYARRGYDAAMKYLSHYEQRLARLFDFLREHYVHAPDVYRLAEEAHLSPWHLHRLYHQVMGETLHETVKRMRLHRAAWLLLYSDRPVAAVARECGYQGNAQSFARVFRAIAVRQSLRAGGASAEAVWRNVCNFYAQSRPAEAVWIIRKADSWEALRKGTDAAEREFYRLWHEMLAFVTGGGQLPPAVEPAPRIGHKRERKPVNWAAIREALGGAA